ncbi:MAG: ATP-grasp domain-containing protein [Peptoniphilus sp.]|nr:ATP-grasp domain-containing protein [Peptoniphilus sp.]MDD7363064.1 ATP-grasp domain-containing protein [Bacillota bacterium]MDY6045329.1 ATP-grasp domain-containing protein [Peptoniphilus sp.]
MRIGIIRDISQIDRKTPAAAKAEADYQNGVVKHIEKALDEQYDVIEYVFDDDIVKKLEEDGIDLVFNLANGKDDIEDRTELPTLLNAAGIPYTGSNAIGHGISDDKALTAAVLERNDIAHPKTDVADSPVSLAKIDVTYPVVVKPNCDGSSRGITDVCFVRDAEDLFKASRDLFAYTDEIVLSEYIDGKEITVGVIGNGEDKEILPPVEVDFSNVGHHPKIFTFDVKHKDLVDYHVPARLTEAEKKAVEDTARRVYDLLQLRDYARIDMRVKDGTAYVLEVNALAGLDPKTSDIIKGAEAAGLSYDEFIRKIVEVAMARENLTDDGKKGDVEDIRERRREENKAAHRRALTTLKERLAEQTKEKIEDFQEETKRRGRAYKEDARQKAYEWGHKADEAIDDFEEEARRRGDLYREKASEWRDRADETLEDFGEEAKRRGNAYRADMRQKAYEWGHKADEAIDDFEEEARRRGRAYKEGAKQKAAEWYDKAEDLRDDMEEEADVYAGDWNEQHPYNAGYPEPDRYENRPVDDPRYAALERRVHALEERIRLLENRNK